MDQPSVAVFDDEVWASALTKYGAAVQMSVSLFGTDERMILGPLPITPMVALFEKSGHKPDACAKCVRACLAQSSGSRPPIVEISSGLAVVGVSLVFDGVIAGVLIAGYTLVTFCESLAIARLARETGVIFQELWAEARKLRPIPARRLIQHGELLQVLGDTVLRENLLRRSSEDTARHLVTVAEVKEGFLAVLSHELRTPLTPILGWASILKQQGDAKVVHAAGAIERNALFQLRMVEDLLELTRTMKGKLVLNRHIVCLNDQVRAALETVAASTLKNTAVPQFIDAPELLCLNADGDRMQQILRNVLANAVKFTPPGGAITVTLAKEGEMAVVRVRDTGEGIAPEFLPSVFEMFQQQEQGTRRTHPGLGIGLALVKQLTEAHDGTVSVTSDGVGLGAEVTMRWPLAAAPEPPLLEADAEPPALDGLRLLVVEDMEDSRETVCVMLERLGATVVSAENGVDALDKAGEDVDLILCDLRMPTMDGFEFLRALDRRDGRRRPPVIAVSGLASSLDHLATQAAGFIGHIDKPFDSGRLLAAVQVAMNPLSEGKVSG